MKSIWSIMIANKKETLLFSSTLLIALFIYIRVEFHLPILSPTSVISHIVEPLASPIAQWMEGANP